MSSRRLRAEAPTPGQKFALEVTRVRDTGEWIVYVISDRYYGLFTHYTKQGSRACQGVDCRFCKAVEKVWKGYAAVELLHKEAKCWVPTVLELTEHAELDVRGVWKRGQMWGFTQRVPEGKKHPAVTGQLLPPRKDPVVPAEFDIRPVLKNFYRLIELPPTIPNPLPPRVVVEARFIETPGSKAEQSPAESIGAQILAQRLNRALETPREAKNGVANGH